MGDYYNRQTQKWEKRKIIVPEDSLCLCWLLECNCQFQRHTNCFVFCEDPEIFQLCINKEDINYG